MSMDNVPPCIGVLAGWVIKTLILGRNLAIAGFTFVETSLNDIRSIPGHCMQQQAVTGGSR